MKLYNTLNKRVEEIVPRNEGVINMYTCGPTVYHFAHIGNLRTYITEDILEKALKYLGYKVSARLEIPKLNINSNVLEEYSTEGLEVCISKFWGSNPNEIGNYCIAGHNYGRKNMFGYLGDLEIGDKIYLSDNKNGKFSYTIYDKYRIEADNTEPLSQDTNKREITLITCSSYSNKRLIIKAAED